MQAPNRHTTRLVVLASGTGSNLQAILDACTAGDLDAEVVAVVSDKDNAYALKRAADAGVPSVHIGPQAGEEPPNECGAQPVAAAIAGPLAPSLRRSMART